MSTSIVNNHICCFNPAVVQEYAELLGEVAPTGKPNGHAPFGAQNVVPMLEGAARAATDSAATGSNLMGSIADQLEKFIFLENRRVYPLIALWIIGTHLHASFDYYPYLLIHSPEPGCGKTRVLECIDKLCWNNKMLTDPTSAYMFHTASTTTQLIDEIDTWSKDKDLSSILNAGFQRGGVVPRLQKDGAGNFTNVADYEVYGPKALAGIKPPGRELLKPATRTRVLNIQIIKQNRAERRERLSKSARESFGPLRDKLVLWVQSNRVAVQRVYETGRFEYLDQYDDRTIDVMRPLAAILEVLSPTNETRREFLRIIPEVRTGEKNDNNIDILEALASVAQLDQPLIGSASQLAALIMDKMHGASEPVVTAAISKTLHRYGVTTKSMRLPGGESRRRYEISLSKLKDLLDRYATHGPEATAE